MTTHRNRPRLATLTSAAVLILALLTGCGFGGSGSGTVGAEPATVDRSDPQQASDAFMIAYASGDLASACAMGTPQLQQRLDEQGRCQGRAGWNQTVTASKGCIDQDDGEFYVTYTANGHIDRFITFIVRTKNVDGQWTPDAVRSKGPSSEPDYVCVRAATSSPEMSAG